ncbi:hypothetical protein [Pseudonocardia acaciae]|uniref:hypothetical protein n=1 Tax=Pseudonocardia acaciae TaxID=551276 RepID=UPI000490C1CE|nr:hypothetical protein [Pseudonocardia acaciae]
MGVFAAFGMAARRWYILLPMVALSAGAAWLAYTQMPASYDATAVYRVTGGAEAAVQARAGSPQVNPGEVAGRLIGKMQPGAGRPAGPYTVSGRPGSPMITIKASGDGATQALDRIGAANTRLNAALNTLETERVIPPNAGLRLDATMPPTTGPPIRDTGIQVFVVTLVFGLMLSLVFAAAVERSSRRRRALTEPSEPPAPSEDDKPTDVVARIKDAPPAAEPPAAPAVSDADRVAAKTERHALAADRHPPDTERPGPDPDRDVAEADRDAPGAGQVPPGAGQVPAGAGQGAPGAERRAPDVERRAPDAGRPAPEVERAAEPVASTGTHALQPTRARSGAHALHEEPDEPEADAGASLATSAIPMGSLRSQDEDAGASLATSAIPMGSVTSNEGPDESLATSAIPMGSVMSGESGVDESLATSAIPMGSLRSQDEDAGASLATSAIPMGSVTPNDPNEEPDESSNESVSVDESLATTAIPMGSVTSTSADESLATTAIPMGSVTSTSADESLVTTAIPLPPADRLVPPPGSFPGGADQSPAAAAMRTAMNTPSRPVGESMGRPGPPDRPRETRPISPVGRPGPLPPEPPRRPAHALIEPPEPSAPREPPARIDLSGATELSDLSELRLPTPPAPLGPRPPDPSIGLLGSRPPAGDQYGRPVPPANQEPPRSGPPLSLVPSGPAPGPQGPPDSFADREDPPEQPRTPPRLRAVPPLDERPDQRPPGLASGERWEPDTSSAGNADGWLPANVPSTLSSEPSEPYEPSGPYEPAEPVAYEPHERPETRHAPEPVEYDDIPAGFELDDVEDERPPARWDDLATAGDPVEEPIDEEPADHRWDSELSGRDDDADAEDQFGWPEFADEETADEDEVRDEAPAAPPVDDDDEEDAVESWERWGDENERPASPGDENERRVSRGAATG